MNDKLLMYSLYQGCISNSLSKINLGEFNLKKSNSEEDTISKNINRIMYNFGYLTKTVEFPFKIKNDGIFLRIPYINS